MEIATYVQKETLFAEVSKLLEAIRLAYHIGEPDPEFIAHFANIVKKHFGHLTFEQLHLAFEANALGYLDRYLARPGFAPDNKIRNFNIPDLLKVVRAFVQYKQIENPVKKQIENKLTEDQKVKIRHQWVKELVGVFEKYKNTGELSHIGLPAYTCKVLAMLGVIDLSEVNTNERRHDIHARFAHMDVRRSSKSRKTELGPNMRLTNVQLIYTAFDRLIDENHCLASLLEKYKNEFSLINEMPL